jgi:hypothetical protein
MRDERRGPWVVYLMSVHGRTELLRAVCEQSEWDAMERATPGARTLIRAGITSEGEAEVLARGTSGDRVPAAARNKKAADLPPPGPTIG